MLASLQLYLSCAAILIVLGALDDYFDISFKVRLVVQAGISLTMILIGQHSLHNFGYLMGSEAIALGEIAGSVITIIAVIVRLMSLIWLMLLMLLMVYSVD